jgi:malate dehydrogenase (oxaloacetate-decarboxylating)
MEGVKLVNISDRTFLLHLGGKIETKAKNPIQNRDDLSRVYTPDVARVCMAIHEEQRKAFTLTIKRNTVAVVSDGSAVLGLGNIGPYAAMPVMEGKAMLFKQFADVDSFPICLDTQDTDRSLQLLKPLPLLSEGSIWRIFLLPAALRSKSGSVRNWTSLYSMMISMEPRLFYMRH